MKRLIKPLLATGAVALALLVFSPSIAEAGSRTVASGDTLSSMFGSRWQEVYAINREVISDPDLIYPGEVLNDGLDDTTTAPVQSAPVLAEQPQPIQTVQRASGGANTYAYGWCTWWVKEKRPDIGGYWGNAGYNWITAANNAGFATGYTPRSGAIGVMSGHVVYIESVSGNMVNLSEMGYNYTPGIVTYRTVPASGFTYIY